MSQTTKMVKSLQVTVKKRGQVLIQGCPGKKTSTVAQCHDKKMNLDMLRINLQPSTASSLPPAGPEASQNKPSPPAAPPSAEA